MRKIAFLFAVLIMGSASVFAQFTIKGKVSDVNGVPVVGATVTVKKDQVSTMTGTDGSFTIQSKSASGQLDISGIGFAPQTVNFSGTDMVDIVMAKKAEELSEVIVTALGVRKEKRGLGYAVSEVKGDKLNNANNQNVVNSLNGKVAGVQVISGGGAPGQASRITIRGGAKSITGDNQPLFVIDGIAVSNEDDGSGSYTEVEGVATPNRVADINPDDIESMSVLKGSAASVLYGNRGANGVIIITTKSGRGRGGAPVITVSSTVGYDNPLKLPDFQTIYAQGTDPNKYTEGTSRSFGPRIMGQNVYSNVAKQDSVVLRAYNPREDFLRTGVTTNHNVSIAQSKDKTSYFMSFGYSGQSSVVPNQDYKKASARVNVTQQVTDKFTTGVNFSYVRSWGDVAYLGQDGNNPFFALFNMPISWDINGYGYVRPDGTQINFRGGSFDNPLWTVNKTFFTTANDHITALANFGYKFTSWLDVNYKIGIDQINDDRKSFKDINTGSQPNGSLANDLINRQGITSTLLFNVNRRLSNNIGFTLTAGQDYFQRKLTNYTQTATAMIIPDIPHMSNASAFASDFEYRSKRRLIGAFGDLKFDYKNYLFLGITGRNEWSSTLPEENRSYFFPGANAALIFTDAFGMDNSVLNYGKLRVGYAQTARDPAAYQVINTYVVPDNTVAAGYGDGFVSASAPLQFPFTGIPGYTVSNIINNPELKSEKTSEVEVGLELKFLKNRIGLEATYFSNENKDGIVPVDVSPAVGATNIVVNSGLTKVKGVEIGLNLVPVSTGKFTWSADITFSRIRSKVVETYPGVDKIYIGGFSGNPAIFAVKGERYGSIIGTGYQKDANGNVLVDIDGFPLFADGVNLGYIEPDWTGGIRNTLKFKNISFDFLIDTRQGGYLYNGTEELLDFYGVSQKTSTREEDYIFPGVNESDGKPNTTVVKRDLTWWNFAQGNEEYVYENNWVRLREVNLNYTYTPANAKILKSFTFGIYGRNLWLSTDIPHVDPESSSFGTNNGQGATRMAFPTLRSMGASLKLTF